jgi:hypothetical protein
MRLGGFIIAILLLAGAVDPTRGPLIVLTVLSGLAAIRWRPWRPFSARAFPDARLATFVLAVLLLAGVIDPTRGWLIGLTVAAGLAATEAGGWFHTHEHGWFGGAPYIRFRSGGRRSYWRERWDGDDWR